MKLAIVVDSSCGLTKEQAKKRGWHFLPLYIEINGKEYADGIDLTPESFSKIYKDGIETKTSCTPPGEAIKLFEELSKNNDFVVVYPISQFLSSQVQNLDVLSKSFKNVFVIKSKNVAQLIVKELVEFEKSVLSNELTVKQAIAKIENKDRSTPEILLFPKTMDSLVKGGRLSPSAAKMAKLLKIVPVIGWKDGKLEKFTKGRIFNKVVPNVSIEHFEKLNGKNKKTSFMFLDTLNEQAEDIFEQIRKETNYKKPYARFDIPPVIAIHTGFGAISVFFPEFELDFKDYNFDQKE